MRKFFQLLLLLVLSYTISFSQKHNKQVYVIVHGAWGGSWAFKKVDSLLTEKGSLVYRPSLTGQGERVHLASKEVGLETHIKDVVNMILYEDLYDVILVGHSYGGMVVTGVADSVPQRIKKLIYLDAFVPDNGESALHLWGKKSEWFRKMEVNGFAMPAWVKANQLPPKDVPQPVKTFNNRIILKNKLRLTVPTTYILTVAKNTIASEDDFFSQAEKAKQKGWPIVHLEADHNPQWSAPENLVKMINAIVNN
jgi:pimeloyl-ACP methyl ester carboxylesterase